MTLIFVLGYPRTGHRMNVGIGLSEIVADAAGAAAVTVLAAVA